jgi:hypothetical protein
MAGRRRFNDDGTPVSAFSAAQRADAEAAGLDIQKSFRGSKTPKSKGLSSSTTAGLSIAAGIAGSEIQGQNPTSSGAGAVGGALSGAAAGASMGALIPGGALAGAGIGAVVGGVSGSAKAKRARRRMEGQIESDRLQAQSAILGEKGRRIDSALSGMRQAFSAALLQNRKLNLR